MLKRSLLFFILLNVVISNAALAANTYGPLKKGDLLWKIAEEVRPDSVTRKQMMLALLHKNPQAFQPITCNFNSLKVGEMFTIPTIAEIQKISPEEAEKEYTRQNKEWELYRKVGRKIYCPPVELEAKPEPVEEVKPDTPTVVSNTEKPETTAEVEATETATEPTSTEVATPVEEPTIIADATMAEETQPPVPTAPDNAATDMTEDASNEDIVPETEEETTVAETEIASPFLATEEVEEDVMTDESAAVPEAEDAPALDASKNKLLGIWILVSAILAILLVGVVFYNRGKQKHNPIPQRLR
jgi:pilus assembly protein FimV